MKILPISKWFSARQNHLNVPICMATSPGFAVAVQLRTEIARPQLLKAHVLDSRAQVSSKLDALANQLNLKKNQVHLLLEDGDYQFLQTELPQIPEEEWLNAIRWQVKDMLRVPLEISTLDLIAPPQQGARRPQGFVVAAANSLLRERMLQFRPYQSEVAVIDIPELAQRNMATLLEVEGHSTVILSVTSAGCLLTACRNGVLYFTRTFDLTAFSLADSIETRREQFDRLLLELQRSLDVIEHQYPALSAPVLWLAPFAHVDELLSLLIDNLYLPVHAIALDSLLDCTHCPLPTEPIRQAALFHALGLCLRPKETAQ